MKFSAPQLAFFIVFLILILTMCSRRQDPRAGTRRMAERLKKLAENADPETNLFASAERVKYWRRQKPANPQGQMINRLQLGMELLHNGQAEEAIAQLEQVLHDATQGPKSHMAPAGFEMDVREYLALAYLRLGGQNGRSARPSTESSLFPIRASGIHTNQRRLRAAIREYLALLEVYPNDLNYRWLLNIAYMRLGEYPGKVPEKLRMPPKVFEADYDIKRFHDVAPQLGLGVTSLAGGSVMEDLDGDDDLDIMVSSWSLHDPIRCFRNNGDGTFTEMMETSGLDGITGGVNLNHADYNNDGYPDIFVMRGAWLAQNGKHPNSLLRNNGDWTFDDVTEQAGLLSFHPTPTAAWGDYDNDGWIDLFVGNESNVNPLTLPRNSGLALWIERFAGNQANADRINPCELYHNNGDGTFTEVAAQAGVTTGGFVKGAVWDDYDNDGLLDLYVSRLREPNVLYRNQGRNAAGEWSFKERIKIAVATENGGRDIYATVTTGGSFGSSSLQQEIGLGQATSIRAIEITWPTTGKVQVFKNVGMNQMLKIREGDPVPVPIKLKRFDLSPDAIRTNHAESSHDHRRHDQNQ
jgi:hypothetical protein